MLAAFRPGITGPALGGVQDVLEWGGLEAGADLVAALGGQPSVDAETGKLAGVKVGLPDLADRRWARQGARLIGRSRIDDGL